MLPLKIRRDEVIDSHVPLLIGWAPVCLRFYFLFTYVNDVTVAQDGSAHILDILVFRFSQWEEATLRHPSLFYVHVMTYRRGTEPLMAHIRLNGLGRSSLSLVFVWRVYDETGL